MVLHVDIGEILALAWNNPLYTGGLVLLFTPPVFRVIFFFYPLLISTALCAVALVSVGQHIEASREREIAGWNAKIVDGDGLASRLGTATGPRNEGPREDAWLNLVQNFEPSRSSSNNYSERSNCPNDDNKDEGLKKHQFRVDDGRMVFLDDQDLLDRQIEAFREYERKFSVKNRAEATVASDIAAASNGGASPRTSSSTSTRTISLPEKRDSNCDVPARNIPPMVLYNLRTGGTGRAGKGSRGTGAEAFSSCASGAPASPGISSFPSTRTISVPEKHDSNWDVPTDSNGGPLPGISSSPSTRTISVPEKRGSDCAAPTRKIPPMVLYNLRTGGTGRAGKASSETAGEARSSSSGAPAAVTGSQEKAYVAEGHPYGSIDGFSRNVNVVDSSFVMKRSTQPPLPMPRQKQSSSVFETGTTVTTPAADMEARLFATAKNLNRNSSTKNVPWPGLGETHYELEGQLEGFPKTFGGREKDNLKTSVFSEIRPASSGVASLSTRSEESHRSPTGKVSLKRLFAPLGPIIDSSSVASRVASPAKPVEERTLRRARTHNSALRSGNAVIYNAGSSAVPSTRKSYGSVQKK